MPLGSRSLLVALTAALTAGREIQLLPAGEFAARDGRPGDGRTWKIDAAQAATLIAAANSRKTPYVIDYEHQTLHAERNGRPAPAAGWFKTLEWRDGKGLYATDVEWTERAAAMIQAGEYKFLSPVFVADVASGAVVEMLMAAVTNNPALDGMDAVAARFSEPPETPMNETLKKLLAALGLPENTVEADALTAVAALKTKSEAAAAEIVALKAAAPDPAKFVPVETMKALQTEVAALTARITGGEVDSLVKGAIEGGKLLPAQEKWARDLGASDLAALKAYLDTAQAIAALKGTQTGGKPAQGAAAGAESLSEAELAICKAMALDPKDYAASKAA